MVIKLNNILEQITTNFNNLEQQHELLTGRIEIKNEDHTIGNLLSRGLQNHKNVSFASYHLPHPLEKRVIIEYKLKSGKFIEVLKDVTNEFIELYNKLDKLIEKS